MTGTIDGVVGRIEIIITRAVALYYNIRRATRCTVQILEDCNETVKKVSSMSEKIKSRVFDNYCI